MIQAKTSLLKNTLFVFVCLSYKKWFGKVRTSAKSSPLQSGWCWLHLEASVLEGQASGYLSGWQEDIVHTKMWRLMWRTQKLSRRLLVALNQNILAFKVSFVYSQRSSGNTTGNATGGQQVCLWLVLFSTSFFSSKFWGSKDLAILLQLVSRLKIFQQGLSWAQLVWS